MQNQFARSPAAAKTSGIYRIRNKINNKLYVGSSKVVEFRFHRHRDDLRNGRHKNSYLQNAWNKYGESQFTFELISEVDQPSLLEMEQEAIRSSRCLEAEFGYNICVDVRRPPMTDETRKKMRSAKLGKPSPLKGSKRGPLSEKHKAALLESHLGKPRSEETKQKIRTALKGRIVPDHEKKKMSEARKGIKSGMLGKHHSEETKQKIREKLRLRNAAI